ncbi:SIR2 family protein, partial [Thiolapillus sp.]|uniref:SIR2 family protein n=1 Tax=Thiolapillus sp. TaxID=2017437 RepID=UPI0025EF909C
MQFIADGPEIPNVLLQAHEEGRVVFFCGAGISYPAGLPDFKGLVEQIYRRIGTVFTERERYAFDREQYDATLDLLERRLPGPRRAVRRALAQVLKTGLGHKDAYDTHAALLRLARSPEDSLRLVTTNFDRMFHAAARRTKQEFHAYTAPMLPIPKNSRWNGLVYLHGRLPEEPDDTALNQLVVTSGDFGLAYLTERWAARFVSELFRNYVVCFVGYSINDPVLRYMMDALAADRMLGEVTPQAWALGDCEPGQEHRKTIEWEAKGVTPILYEVPAGSHDHSALYQTLHAWADTYCDDIQGKERIVDNYALKNPSDSTPQNDFVGRMLWALSDKSGLPAKRFADFNPVPSLDWLLEAFSDEHFQHSDLARWLRRYLNDPRLIIWIAQREGPLPSQWVLKTREALHDFASLERDGKTAVLDEIRSRSPKAIPGPLMRTLWRLLLSGRVKSSGRDSDPNSDLCSNLKRWKEDLKQEGVTATLRWELREMLAPQVVLKKPFFSDNEAENIDEPTQISQLMEMDWELALTTDHLHLALHEIADEHWTSALPLLLEDFQQLLR